MNCDEVVLGINTVFRTLIICSCLVKKVWDITTQREIISPAKCVKITNISNDTNKSKFHE
jgi:hypothetical protein